MGFDFDSEMKSGYILLTATGVLESIEDLFAYVRAIMALASKYNISRVLLDSRQTSRKLDQYDYVTFADKWAVECPRTGIKIASLYSTADARKYRWIETILRNRTILCRMFDNMEDARTWLMIENCREKIK